MQITLYRVVIRVSKRLYSAFDGCYCYQWPLTVLGLVIWLRIPLTTWAFPIIAYNFSHHHTSLAEAMYRMLLIAIYLVKRCPHFVES